MTVSTPSSQARWRVALVVNRYPVPSQTFIRTQFEGLRTAGIDCRIVDKAIDPLGDRQTRIDGVERLPVLSRATYPAELVVRTAGSILRRPRAARANVRAARGLGQPLLGPHWLTHGRLTALRPDMVHYSFASYALGEEHLAAALGIPLIVSCRGYDLTHVAGGAGDVYRRLWAAVDFVHFRSRDLRDLAIQLGFDPSTPHLITPPGIDADYFSPDATRQSRSTRGGHLVIASVGRLVEKKGHEIALQVVAGLRARGLDVYYELIGAGGRESELRGLAEKLGIAGVTRFLGEQPPAKVRATVRGADLLLHPSWQEGFGVSVLEAQALEVPVVCSDAEGLAENVAHGESGYVVPAGDVASMTERSAEILTDHDLAERLGRAGRRRVLELFTVEREIDAYVASYRSVLENRPEGATAPTEPEQTTTGAVLMPRAEVAGDGTKKRGVLFLLPLEATPGVGPTAAWATTGGWATGAERVLGAAWVLSDSGTFGPAETLQRVTPPLTGSMDNSTPRTAGDGSTPIPRRPRWWTKIRKWIPEPAITLVKDLQHARSGWRRTRSIDPSPWLSQDLLFVWQRHALFRRCGIRFARVLGVPLVVSVHAMQVEEAAGWGVRRPGWARLAETFGELPQLRAADLVACVSEEVASSVRRRGIPEHRILVTPNGVDTDRFRPGPPDEELRHRLGLAGRFVIGWSGSFRGFHGLDVALEAVAHLQLHHPEVALLLIGDGQQRATIEAAAQRLEIQSLVMVGAVPFDDVARYLRLCDVGLVLAPTTGTFHYSPVKLREYLACGLPVIAHDAGELSTILTDGEDALVAPRGDASALAEALARVIRDPDLRARLRERGPQLAHLRWSWEAPLRAVIARLAHLSDVDESEPGDAPG